MQCAKIITLQLLRVYKWAFSPMFAGACRYVPSCSEYAMEAVERYGAVRGGWMALGRVLRCHPLGGSGYDPVMRAGLHTTQRIVTQRIMKGRCADSAAMRAPRI